MPDLVGSLTTLAHPLQERASGSELPERQAGEAELSILPLAEDDEHVRRSQGVVAEVRPRHEAADDVTAFLCALCNSLATHSLTDIGLLV